MRELKTVELAQISNLDVTFYVSTNDNMELPHKYKSHVHDTIELFILFEGDVSYVVENNIYKLTKGDVLITKPNEVHNCVINSETVNKHACIRIGGDNKYLTENLLSHEYGVNNLLSPSAKEKEELIENCLKLDEYTSANEKILAYTCILRILDIINKNTPCDINSNVYPEDLVAALNLINDKFTSINTAQQITDMINVSRSTLCRLFKTHMRTSPKIYLETKKLAYARRLLKEGKSVTDAAFEAGFNEYSNFIRTFKKQFGITPFKYKNS